MTEKWGEIQGKWGIVQVSREFVSSEFKLLGFLTVLQTVLSPGLQVACEIINITGSCMQESGNSYIISRMVHSQEHSIHMHTCARA